MTTRDVHGISVPSFIYGTAWKEQRTQGLTEMALDAGFRAIDTANQRKHYHELGVGAAIATAIQGGLRRDELFLQTKFTYQRGQDHRLPYDPQASFTDQVNQSFASSLDHLGTDYIDSYLLHGPSHRAGISDADWEVWRAMEQLQRDGKTRLIGVSNMTSGQLQTLFDGADIKPAFIQNRCYARYDWDADVRAVCDANDITYQGFSLLTANDRDVRTPEYQQRATAQGLTIAQLVFKEAMAMGILPLTGTSDREHMRLDLAVR